MDAVSSMTTTYEKKLFRRWINGDVDVEETSANT
ncbi:hypothetical protein F441_14742 [Phytophthora nicotianae CJ01A1]|uniref:Uncharacterized protein n=1 Tax=Phytophthora nicotianae CJ01A1 TaxID=1317063 RepID=W2WFV2_PHYNI|nr:hypothetical protein F441_14742 [Phytophthora nicotianae CJ01A1]